ncbi:hypothetical protein Pse7367_1137 [Thalassoporum mexicanum PCC 7367]|uniref:cyanoexosortase A system-associated protein n=1 Tax=Thalassoporum mexicanum TaxID=3457544 RepID=UPI00029F88D5|nr:cyanoexosortase A system-associated protein [Pseudanabaena sp. PCC 7367]AFY69434.1 hypothetical protein Pse7367_1137 [Pseudanabaena sp. PCC 7367]
MNKIRLPLLAAICGSIVLVFGASLLNLKVGDRAFKLPEQAPLDGWQLQDSKPISTEPKAIGEEDEPVAETVIIAKHYQYSQGDRRLDLEIRYIANSYGQIPAIIPAYTNIADPEFQEIIGDNMTSLKKSIDGIGSYNLFSYQNKAYLSTCITPYGTIIANQDDFFINLRTSQSLKANLLPWALGQTPLRDRRCVWAHLYINIDPNQNGAEAQAYETLEASLGNLSQWWRSQLLPANQNS